MSRINNAFAQDKAFIGFVTGGDPSVGKSEDFILRMVEAGADLIEIGVPFSDPIAEGPVIQRANIRALSAGTTLDELFALVVRLRRKTNVPLVFLTYLNPIFRFGYDTFFRKCQNTGLDGIIIPDLPFEEQAEVRDIAYKYGVDIISLVAPTSEERIDSIAKSASGFVYIVSSMGVTGVRDKITTDLAAMVKRIKRIKCIPTAVGFGISTPAQAAEITKVADGVIVGSAIVKLIELYGENADERIFEYVKEMKEAIASATE